MVFPNLMSAVVLCFEKSDIQPGDQTRAVTIPGTSEIVMTLWRAVNVGDELVLYAGARVCGHGRVLWIFEATLPVSAATEKSLHDWCAGGPPPDQL
jgi:hypothetical protein